MHQHALFVNAQLRLRFCCMSHMYYFRTCPHREIELCATHVHTQKHKNSTQDARASQNTRQQHHPTLHTYLILFQFTITPIPAFHYKNFTSKNDLKRMMKLSELPHNIKNSLWRSRRRRAQVGHCTKHAHAHKRICLHPFLSAPPIQDNTINARCATGECEASSGNALRCTDLCAALEGG